MHEQAIGELQALVAQNPYRERFVAQLMLALYRSGRHAEALDAYEKTRRRLDDDLGLQPSADLQQLSGQIVRQDPSLRRAPPSARSAVASVVPQGADDRRAAVSSPPLPSSDRRSCSRRAEGLRSPIRWRLDCSAARPRLAGSRLTARVSRERSGDGRRQRERSSTTLESAGRATSILTHRRTGVDSVVTRLRKGGVGLVVALGNGPDARALAKVVRGLPETRFVFVDASLSDLSLDGVPNAAAIRFAEEDVLHLGGYLERLSCPTMDGSKRRVDRCLGRRGSADP